MDALEQMAETREDLRTRLKEIDVLIIDEISMVQNIFFERLNRMMRAARETEAPFGGVQIIVCGDFRQLPPVSPFAYCFHCGGKTEDARDRGRKVDIKRCKSCRGEEDVANQWAFCSAAWEACDFTNINLTENHRQDEPEFVRILTTLSRGNALSSADQNLLFNHPCDVQNATHLFAYNSDVDAMNEERYGNLDAEAVDYKSLDSFRWNPKDQMLRYFDTRSPDGHGLRALADHHYKSTLSLKIGQPVVLTLNVNVEKGLVNGAQGTIRGFKTYEEVVPPRSGEDVDEGQGEAGVTPDLGERPDSSVRGGEFAAYRQEQIKTFLATGSGIRLPIVKFNNGKTVLILPDCNVAQVGDDYPFSLLSRTQIPLTAGWAMTVHKAQGMTMDKVVVNIPKKNFSTRHAYVALSRARSLSGLRVLDHRAGLNNKAGGPDKVKDFMLDTDWYIG